MATTKNTPYNNYNIANDYHRVQGSICYEMDIDVIEFTYINGKPIPIAIVDWKYPGKCLSDNFTCSQQQIAVADLLNVPLFFAITYLDDNFPVKMYYLIPINDIAHRFFFSNNVNQNGVWLTVLGYSRFLHKLRNKTWNGNEIINEKNLAAIGFSTPMKLKDLPNKYKEYELPKLDFSWMRK